MANQQTASNGENGTAQRNLVLFRLGQQRYALPIEPIVQIVPMVTITPIPQVNHSVEGVINVRGAAVPVVSLRRHMGLPATDLQLHTPIMLVQIGQRVVGLIVDEVLDVLNIPLHQTIDLNEILPRELGDAPVLQGLARLREGTVLMLNVDQLFQPAQTNALRQAADALQTVLPPEPPAVTGDEGVSEG